MVMFGKSHSCVIVKAQFTWGHKPNSHKDLLFQYPAAAHFETI